MKTVLNILWFIICGLWSGLCWLFLGLILCITIIGIPLGRQCFKAASLTFAPFGKEVKCNFDSHPIANILWVIIAGWEMALSYLFLGILCCITVIGIPCGIQALKLMKLAFLPFGAQIVKAK